MTRLWIALSIALVGCTAPVEPATPPMLDRCVFERDVYPVLARDCAFGACHGAPERFFRVYAPGRTRLDVRIGPASEAEIDATFERARSMLVAAHTPEDSLLLRKPLELSAGGAAHAGRDRFGRNLFANKDDDRWEAMFFWASGDDRGFPCE